MQAPIHPEYTSHLVGAPARRHWPLALLLGVGAEAAVAAVAMIVVILSVMFV